MFLHQLYEMDQKVRNSIQNHDYGKLAKELHEFCNNNLSAFYFDIRKDRLYCDDPSSFDRHATRSVMAEIFNCLVSWLAPILSFTSEEAWSHRPTGVFEEAESVHLREFPEVSEKWKNGKLADKWSNILFIRKAVLEAVEPLRASKELGSSLEAKPVITTSKDNVKTDLESVNMADICITSGVVIKDGECGVTIEKADGEKCVRCWKVLPEVSDHADHLCNRCDDVVNKKKAA